MSSPSLALRVVRVFFFVATVGSVLVSAILSGAQTLPLLSGLAAGVLSALVASVLSRIPATRGWLTLPVVMIQCVALQVARSRYSGAEPTFYIQFAGVALAVYGAAFVLRRIGVLGSDQPVEP